MPKTHVEGWMLPAGQEALDTNWEFISTGPICMGERGAGGRYECVSEDMIHTATCKNCRRIVNSRPMFKIDKEAHDG